MNMHIFMNIFGNRSIALHQWHTSHHCCRYTYSNVIWRHFFSPSAASQYT